MSKAIFRSFFLGALTVSSVGLAIAQDPLPPPPVGWIWCENPPNPHSPDYIVLQISEYFIGNTSGTPDTPLFTTSLGLQGTTGFVAGCPVVPPYAVSHSGRYGFGSGSVGSIHSTIDDNMMYTFGMPDDPGNSFAYTCVALGNPANPQRVLFGTGPWTLFFIGESDRYIVAENDMAGVRTRLNIDVLGDCARYEWKVTNTGPTATPIGLWSGAFIALINSEGTTWKGYIGPDAPFISIPGQRPTNLETRWTRRENPALFPAYVNFDWSQSEPYGLRIETGPSPSTTDPRTHVSDASQADEFELGNHGEFVSGPGLLGDSNLSSPTIPDQLFPFVHIEPGFKQSDIPYNTNPGYVIKYDGVNVAPGASRTFVQYYRSTWGQSDYVPPYVVVVDAPKLINFDANGLNQLSPNPATVRVWVDNIRGFTSAEHEVPLVNVRVTLDLTSSTGLTLPGGAKQQTKTIATIGPRRISHVDFQVEADGIASGIQPIVVRVVAPPGPNKTLVANTDISTTPKIPVVAGSNLVTVAWDFDDTSWSSVLGLSQPSQFQAFTWDPVQQGYVLSTSAQRGRGTWLVIVDPSVIPNGYVALQSDPHRPSDMATGTTPIQLQKGWNLIGNPYPYPLPIGQLLGVSSGDPSKSYRWADLVNAGFVSASLAYWDTTSSPPGYKFISGIDAFLQPNVGYWVFVNDASLTLSFPPVFYEGAITSSTANFAKSRAVVDTWTNTDKQWRLQIAARTNDEIDDQNFVGVTTTAANAKLLAIYEPPLAPNQKLGVSILPNTPGQARLAQSLSASTGSQQWTVSVQTKKAGEVTLTWPNMGSVSKGVQFRVVDVATGTSRDMRRTSGYTFNAEANTTRDFHVEARAGTASRAVIGNVVVSGDGRARGGAFTISYTLSADATTTVRILGAGGKEVYTATRGRADRVGENTATWAMRDNANRAVAPGTYRVEIIAETTDGERVRKIVPINVIR
ncbi:MAG: hypothetical protein QOJ65_1024 [Fimbriimonadaceae bacterium]|nr:hypothetical protein [Fimbriimonadaceae bacterium]